MSGFIIVSLDVTSLVKHIEELRIFLADNMIDVTAHIYIAMKLFAAIET